MIRRFTLPAICLTASYLLLTGCGGEPDGVTVEPDVKQTVEAFFDALARPTLDEAGMPDVETTYEQLHPDAKKQQTLKQFNRFWIDWVPSHGPGWIMGTEILEVEMLPDSVLVVVNVTLGNQVDPGMTTEGSPLKLTLRKNGSTWAVYSIEE